MTAHGCRVLGLDPDPSQCQVAEKFGVRALTLSPDADPVSWCLDQTGGTGVGGVLITAATSSSSPFMLLRRSVANELNVLVGVTGLDLRRDLFYEKGIAVSCSYGPGRYDPAYEQAGHDYPIGFVRWTEQRNFQAVLSALQTRSLSTDSLVTHRFPIDQAPAAYELLTSPEPSLGILLQYPRTSELEHRTISITDGSFVHNRPPNSCSSSLGVIGVGNYASRILIPAFLKAGARFHTLSASSGISPVHFGHKFGSLSAVLM